ncbi:MAG TPA: ROK family protein [bacterium]|nr:ROK family protein [bacterium]
MKARVAADLKQFNRMLVYRLVRSHGSISRTAIARQLGMSVPTVIKIFEYFSRLGIMNSDGEGSAALGRRPMLSSLRAEAAYAVGAEYDGVHLSVGLVDLLGNIRTLRRFPAPPDFRLLLGSLLAEKVRELVADSGIAAGMVKGLGVGVPGVVHLDGQFISQAPLVGVRERIGYGPLVSGLEQRLGMPVLVSNDANAAALGELAARGPRLRGDLIFVEIGRGVGAGLVLDGRLRQGPGSAAGEIGYMIFTRESDRSGDGPGWLESSMDLGSFWSEIDQRGFPKPESIERVGRLLAMGIANLCIALDVRTVVLGRSGTEAFGDQLLDCMRLELRSLCPMDISCDFSEADEPGVSGAAGLALEAWLSDICAG